MLNIHGVPLGSKGSSTIMETLIIVVITGIVCAGIAIFIGLRFAL